jgi:hypothetical protein
VLRCVHAIAGDETLGRLQSGFTAGRNERNDRSSHPGMPPLGPVPSAALVRNQPLLWPFIILGPRIAIKGGRYGVITTENHIKNLTD